MSKMNETTTGAGPTPGPWRVVGGPADDYQDGAYEIVGDDGGVAVAHVCRDNGDAALLAAAPTMLQALRAAKKALADILDNHPDVWPTGGLKEAQTPERRAWRKRIEGYRDAARAAIRAAEGGAA